MAFKVVEARTDKLSPIASATAQACEHELGRAGNTLAVGKIGGRQVGAQDHDPLYPNVRQYHISGQTHKPTGTSSLERCF